MEAGKRKAGHRSTLADHPDVREVVPLFVARLPEHVRRLRELRESRDVKELRLLAHRLRGAGKSFGFEAISRHAGEIEDLLVGKGMAEILPILDALIVYMEGVEGFKN